MNPLEAFLAWYNSLPAPHRQEIAGFSFGFLPGYPADQMVPLEGLEDRFKERLTDASNSRLNVVGHLLALRAMFEFIFVRTRSTAAQWEETNRFLSDAKSFFDTEGHASAGDTAETALTEIEFRAKQWIQTCQKWRELVANELSDVVLDRWWRER